MNGDAAAVVFDMDGVLLDSGAHHRAAWAALLDEMGMTRPPEFWRVTIGRPAAEAIALLLGVELASWEARELAMRKRAHHVRLAQRGVLPVARVVEFVAIVTAEDVRFGKPHPDVYARAAEAIGADARRCLAFEDSVVGVHSARGAGMAVIGVTTSHTSRQLVDAGATRSIESFEGLRWPM